MKKPLALLFALALGQAVPASATTIFSDDFNRGISDSVAAGWTEVESDAVDVSRAARATTDQLLQLRDNDPLAIATQSGGISTVGFTNITLTYEWAPTNNTERGDFLWVEWRDGPVGSWTEIARHELIGPASFVFANWGIAGAAGLSDFQFRFRAAVNANNEGAYIDNVLLAGDPATGLVPEPGTLVLLGLGLVGLGISRLRKVA